MLEALDDLFGFRHSILLALDPSSERLFAIASSGYERSAVGAEVELGPAIIGTAASRGRLVVQANLGRSRAMAAAVHGAERVAAEREIPLPGLVGSRSAAAVPLIVGQDIIGALYHGRRADLAATQRSPNILLIPGTSSVAHLRANATGAALTLSEDELTELNRIAS